MNQNANSSQEPDNTTHFGFRDVGENDKAKLVGDVFRSVASRYDVMNDLMSFGAHRLWKRFAVSQSGLRRGDAVLDVAGGSGDLARLFSKQVGKEGRVVLTDINGAMLAEGKTNMVDAGIVGNVDYVLTDAEKLCFPDLSYHCVAISFGLRNVTRKEEALRSMYRVLKPSGRLMVLEFSKPVFSALDKAYNLYSFNVIPKIGKFVTNDEDSYQYLVESIRKHPDQETLRGMMLDAGFDDVKVHNMSGGIVALHLGYKY
ncbi:MAG: bifunctional demethylmenaquinone methyltransferase/2-methoxy-6-polyprenyl-1,4-benzoquinol methylase UbiE [Gammaproteobacteria bacterium]|nr:bifunctional demethylmenaquinone methyltransferase/2-methoxy-6-polyprenyl-1,4-benzoquinol methylase UbiE [Gammaproteobacteria bacterium]